VLRACAVLRAAQSSAVGGVEGGQTGAVSSDTGSAVGAGLGTLAAAVLATVLGQADASGFSALAALRAAVGAEVGVDVTLVTGPSCLADTGAILALAVGAAILLALAFRAIGLEESRLAHALLSDASAVDTGRATSLPAVLTTPPGVALA